jgi:hypothetical protein
MVEDFDDCARNSPPGTPAPTTPARPLPGLPFGFTAKLTGIIEPISEDDAFWVTLTSIYFAPFSVGTQAGVVVPMFTTEETLLGNFAAHNPATYGRDRLAHVRGPGTLSKSNFERAREDHPAHGDVKLPGGASFSPLSNLLDVYRESASYQQAPLTILLLEVAAVALFYVILMALVIVERQADEISLLRSRGATTYQVGAMYLLEGLILGIPCLLAAPFIAAVSTSALGLTPTFEKVNGGELLPTTIPLSAFAFAAIGVGLSVVVLLVPAILVARRSAVARRREQARPGASFLQRYYLDLALAGVAGLLLWSCRRGAPSSSLCDGRCFFRPSSLPRLRSMLAAAALLPGSTPLRFGPGSTPVRAQGVASRRVFGRRRAARETPRGLRPAHHGCRCRDVRRELFDNRESDIR